MKLRHAHSFAGRPAPTRRERGFVLVAVLTLVLLSSMVAVSLLFRLRAENVAEATSAGAEQAWAAAMTGLEAATAPQAAVQLQQIARAGAPVQAVDRLRNQGKGGIVLFEIDQRKVVPVPRLV